MDTASVDALLTLLQRVAAEQQRLWTVEQERRRRHEELEALLPALAEVLDVREAFGKLAALIQGVVPHDVLMFSRMSADRRSVRVQAGTAAGVQELEYPFSNEEETPDARWPYLIAHDLEVRGEVLRALITPRGVPPEYRELRPGPRWLALIAATRVRSSLRVPLRSKGLPVGGVAFLSRRPYAYDDEDGLLALRVADRLALALSHQSLAEEQRRKAAAEERAAALETRVDLLAKELARFSAHRALGASRAWKKVLADATQVAETDTTVLIVGESGTGKEVVARYVHRSSPRAQGPFVALNCAALPEQLLESELFGHEKGAFTGALQARPGKVEQAAGGVLFLDEVGEMSPSVQAKFLRVLQEREFQRLGGSKTLKADVRIVAATNRDLRKAMQSGAFREDLYYRLGVFEIDVPPLRDRPDDILVLAEAFLAEVGSGIGRPAAGISEDAREHLLAHSWPGNVRELRNAIERAVILCHGGLVTREHLPLAVVRPVERAAAPSDLRLEVAERGLLESALAKAKGNKSQAAKLLGLSRGQLYSLMRRHGLTDARR